MERIGRKPYYGSECMKSSAATCSLCLLLVTSPAISADCDNWNTKEFFKTATPKAVTDCLQAKVDLNARTKDGWTPLHWAAGLNENPSVIIILLDSGSGLNARTKDGWTPLHMAAWSNENPAIITTLLDAGADPNVRAKHVITPLHAAARSNNNPAVISALLDAGADAKVKDESGKTPFDHASEKNEKLKNADVYWRLNEEQY